MKLRFTRHALERLEERLISLAEVEEVFQNEYDLYGKESCKIIRGFTAQGRQLDIIVDDKLECILTIFPTKRKLRRPKK